MQTSFGAGTNKKFHGGTLNRTSEVELIRRAGFWWTNAVFLSKVCKCKEIVFFKYSADKQVYDFHLFSISATLSCLQPLFWLPHTFIRSLSRCILFLPHVPSPIILPSTIWVRVFLVALCIHRELNWTDFCGLLQYGGQKTEQQHTVDDRIKCK